MPLNSDNQDSPRPKKKAVKIHRGEMVGFADEVSFKGLKVASVSKKRVSWVIPKPYYLRLAFWLIRSLTSDESSLAQWTRGWKCSWIVLIGKQHYGTFYTRASAIEFEKKFIWDSTSLIRNAPATTKG